MAQDRIGSDEINVTHDVLALMLGVRRASVTDALHILEGRRTDPVLTGADSRAGQGRSAPPGRRHLWLLRG
jgi:hypothetical protein